MTGLGCGGAARAIAVHGERCWLIERAPDGPFEGEEPFGISWDRKEGRVKVVQVGTPDRPGSGA